MVSGHFPVPDRIPGTLIEDVVHLQMLREMLASLCNQQKYRFPGSQPVSFTLKSLDALQREDFWVCEKSDGVRVLVMALGTDAGPEVYLVDRKEDYYLNLGFAFPHHEDPTAVHSNTIIDGELVIDVDPRTGQQTLRLLMFDLVVLDGESLMKKPLSSRYGRLSEYIYKPFRKMMDANPDLRQHFPFDIQIKKMEKSYGIEAVLREHLPSLQHGSDGLIFTSAVGPYVTGTDEKIMKWKPPSENSIDFRLELRFPPLDDEPTRPDYSATPMFLLMMNCGREPEQIFDQMFIDNEEWEEMKESGIQFDNRVIEVAWDPSTSNWKLMRFRDDKAEGNYKDIVQRILVSIREGVEAEQLIQRAGQIKQGWREREAGARQKYEAEKKAWEAKQAAARAPQPPSHPQPQQPQQSSRPALKL